VRRVVQDSDNGGETREVAALASAARGARARLGDGQEVSARDDQRIKEEPRW